MAAGLGRFNEDGEIQSGVAYGAAAFQITDPDDLSVLAPPSGHTVLQVTCPICVRKKEFYDSYFKGPPYSVREIDQEQVPAVVRVYLGDARGRASGSDYFEVPQPDSFSSTSEHPGWLRPLMATSELFRLGVTVAVWRGRKTDRPIDQVGVTSPSDRQTRQGLANPLKDPSWGHFGIATARLKFWNYDYTALLDQANGNGGLQNPEQAMLFSWSAQTPAGGAQPGWIEDDPDTIDLLGRPIHWHRQMWLRSQANLFNPDWGAALVNVRHSLHLYDLYTEEELADGTVEDSSLSYLMRMLRRGYWRAGPLESGYGQYNIDWRVTQDFSRMGINFDDGEVENVIRH